MPGFEMVDLDELFGHIGGQQLDQSERPKILPEAAIMRLRELYDAFIAENPFKPGDLVTVRPGVNRTGDGDPHIVLEVRAPFAEIRNFECVEPGETGSCAFGQKLNIRVLCITGDSAASYWMEHWMLELYTGEGA
jgi:hypothetical protein